MAGIPDSCKPEEALGRMSELNPHRQATVQLDYISARRELKVVNPVADTRIAFVHDWLLALRGGEKCLELLCQLWPEADLFTLLCDRAALSDTLQKIAIRTSFLQRLPLALRHHRCLLPLMPLAISRFRLHGYDVVVSLSHCVAKSVRVAAGIPHLCYCLTPVRYAWHLQEAYLAGQPDWLRPLQRALLAALRQWDRRTAGRVTQFIAISRAVQRRIRDCYGRDSLVIYPPVDVDFYRPAPVQRQGFYLCVSALVPYKRIDLAVEACNRLGRELVVIGAGPELPKLRRRAGRTVRFLGWQPDEVVRGYYRRCRALLFPGEEDFGIVPVEAQACGTPVIAYGVGGATESVLPPGGYSRGSGLLFFPQTVAALVEAICRLEQHADMFDPVTARRQAEQFSKERFCCQMQELVAEATGRQARELRAAA